MERPRKRPAVSPRTTAAVCLAVLDKLCFGQPELCVAFLDPVDVVLYPDYLRLIARPVDLGSVRRRLRQDRVYPGDAFADDVRTCFGNAMVFNRPQEPVFAAAATLLERFEREWGKWADEPPELPLLPVVPKPKLQVQNMSSEAGKIVLKVKKRPPQPPPPLPGAVVQMQQRASEARSRAEGLMAFCEQLAAGKKLEDATAATIAQWRAAPSPVYPSAQLELEARSVISALEDSQTPAEIGAWLVKHLLPLDEAAPTEMLLHHVAAVLVAETEPCVDVVAVVLKTSQLNGSARLWRTVLRAVSRTASARRVLILLKKLVAVAPGPSSPFELLLDELHAQTARFEVAEGMERFARWLLAEQVPARVDGLARTCARYPRLRESIGRLAVEAIAHSSSPESMGDLLQLSYGSDVSAAVVKHLLLARQPDKAAVVADMLLKKHPERVALLLQECFDAAKEDSQSHEPLATALVRRAAERLSGDPLRDFLRRFVSVPNSIRQQRFANVVASAFLASQAGSWERLLAAVARLTWIPNPLLPAIVAPHVTALLQQLGARGTRQPVIEAIFALECAPPEGWESWKANRDELLAALVGFSEEARQEHQRILHFRRVALMK